ncbi:S-layer homology domain-containing protein [Cohnella yongneupensis]|uniref:S-layer homology domain-containing protein n=1 Tax=Cohnella yongneupensis TaxID=425006 RepID=A0ABW0QX30_9BACL
MHSKKALERMTAVFMIFVLLIAFSGGIAAAETRSVSEIGGDGSLPPTVVSLTADRSITMYVGDSRTVHITAHMSDNTTTDVTSAVQWNSSNTNVVSVTSSGGLTATGTGTAALTATLNSQSVSIAITVSQRTGGDGGGTTPSPTPTPPPTGDGNLPPTVVSLTADRSITMYVGNSRALHITAHMSNNTTMDVTSAVQWNSSNTNVVSVTSSGGLTATGIGTATLMATLNSQSVSIAITVSQRTGGDGGGSTPSPTPTPPPTGDGSLPPTVVGLTADRSITMYVGDSRTVHITAHMSNNTTMDVTSAVQWNSSNTNVVSVTSSGGLTATGIGTATLMATLNSQSVSIAITVSQRLAGGEGGGSTLQPTPAPPSSEPKPSPTPGTAKPVLKDSIVDSDSLKSEVTKAIETASVVTFHDLPATDWSSKSVALATQIGFVKGYGDGTFHADGSVTRAEFAVMLVKALGIEAKSSDTFKDVQGHWAEAAIQALKSNGIIGGYAEGTFKPDNEISRAEIALILAKVMDLSAVKGASKFSDVSGSWAEQSINQLADAGIISGEGVNKFHPSDSASRAESVTMILRVLNVNLDLGLKL